MKSPSAIAQSCSHRHGAGTRPIRECDRMPLSPTISKSHVPSRFAGSSRAHESRSPLSRPSSDISVSTPDGPSNHVSCALPVGSVSCDHITLSCPSPARRGVSTIPEGDTNGIAQTALAYCDGHHVALAGRSTLGNEISRSKELNDQGSDRNRRSRF